jgi:hypothetical protein
MIYLECETFISWYRQLEMVRFTFIHYVIVIEEDILLREEQHGMLLGGTLYCCISLWLKHSLLWDKDLKMFIKDIKTNINITDSFIGEMETN